MHKYGLTTFIKQKSVGFKFNKNSWPQHITFIDTFEININLPELIKKLENLLSVHKKISTYVTNEDYFGPNKDILVAKLNNTKELQDLHNSIVYLLESENAIFKRPYILKENYKPHITINNRDEINIGDEIIIKSISIIDKSFNTNVDLRKVIANINLVN